MIIELIGAAGVFITALTPMVVALVKFNSRLRDLEEENEELREEVVTLTAALATERLERKAERKELQDELTASLKKAANYRDVW
jgi:regulator of replication initiation timing